MMQSALDTLPLSALELQALCPGGVLFDVDMSRFSRWSVGGRADVLLQPRSSREVATILQELSKREVRPLIIGHTSNLLFTDDRLQVPVIQIGPRMAEIRVKGLLIEAEGGAWVPLLARKMMEHGLTGAEHICGIPGTIGGLICMNGGSQRKCIGDNVIQVSSCTFDGVRHERGKSECEFGYRKSIFQESKEVITNVKLYLKRGDRSRIRSEMRDILRNRRKKFPRKEPNCGSVFKSDPRMYDEIGPPGAAIELCGLKGTRIGDAEISRQHANFIVNKGSASSRDILLLLNRALDAVESSTGFRMTAEVAYVTPSGDVLPADSIALS